MSAKAESDNRLELAGDPREEGTLNWCLLSAKPGFVKVVDGQREVKRERWLSGQTDMGFERQIHLTQPSQASFSQLPTAWLLGH